MLDFQRARDVYNSIPTPLRMVEHCRDQSLRDPKRITWIDIDVIYFLSYIFKEFYVVFLLS